MKEYIKIQNNKAYQLLNPGGLILVSTYDNNNQPNMAPIAWHCPVDFEPTTRLLFVTDKEHHTFSNIKENKQFVICLVHANQLKEVKELGSISGKKTDKLAKFSIKTFNSEIFNYKIIENCIGYLECKVYNIIDDGAVALVFGEVVNAKVDKEAYNGRLLTENGSGKILHHLSGKIFSSPSNEILQ